MGKIYLRKLKCCDILWEIYILEQLTISFKLQNVLKVISTQALANNIFVFLFYRKAFKSMFFHLIVYFKKYIDVNSSPLTKFIN